MSARQSTVMAALDWLTQHGLIEQSQSADGRVHYRRLDTEPDFEARALALLTIPGDGA